MGPMGKLETKPTTSSRDDTTSEMMADGLPGEHAYTAMCYGSNTGMVTLWNPWEIASEDNAGFSNNGGNFVTDKGDGFLDITFDDYKLYFLDIAAIA